jgi:hypothetical protein
MTIPRRFPLDELTIRPGTYFNPQTEVLIVVDDSPEVDRELFGGEEFEGTEWVLISEDSPLDEERRDELVEQFTLTYAPDGEEPLLDLDDDLDDEDDEEELEAVELE